MSRDLLTHPVRAMRCGGSAGVDMMHVARGRLDAYFEAPELGRAAAAGFELLPERCVEALGTGAVFFWGGI